MHHTAGSCPRTTSSTLLKVNFYWKLDYCAKRKTVIIQLDTQASHYSDIMSISNHWTHDCLLNRLFRRRSKKTSKLRIMGIREGIPPVTSGFPSHRACNVENVSIRWRHNDWDCFATHNLPRSQPYCDVCNGKWCVFVHSCERLHTHQLQSIVTSVNKRIPGKIVDSGTSDLVFLDTNPSNLNMVKYCYHFIFLSQHHNEKLDQTDSTADWDTPCWNTHTHTQYI